MNDNYTIEEVCDMINQYITEKAPRGAYKKQLYKIAKDEKDIKGKIEKLSKIAEYNPHAAEKIDKLKDELHKKTYIMAAPKGNGSTSPTEKFAYVSTAKRAAKGGASDDYIYGIKEQFGQGKNNIKSKLEKKPAGLYATKKESTDVINTKLAIYESCDAGYITEDEKYELLELLED